jgi:hypothetical protein
MAKQGGAKREPRLTDDASVLPEEKLWRLIHPKYWEIQPADSKPDLQTLRGVFSGSEISALRPSYLGDDPLEAVKKVKPGYGIGEFLVSEIRKSDIHGNVIIVRLEDEPEWNKDAHVVIYKSPGNLRLNSTQKAALTDLIAQAIILEPDATKLAPISE